MTSLRLDLPLPPTSNNAYATNRRTGRRHLSTRAQAWKIEAGWTVRAARPPNISGPYSFQILIPEKARGDADGYIKLAQDLLASLGVTPDDRKAVESRATRDPAVTPRRCVVVVAEMRSAA